MDQGQMRQVLTLVKEVGNLSVVSARLYLTQPYITRSIRQAEEQLGNEILQRSHQPLTLTYAGEQYLAYLIEADQQAHNFTLRMQQLNRRAKQVLRIGMNEALGELLLPKVVADLRTNYAGLQIIVEELTTRHAQNKLLAGELDIFIGMPVETSQKLVQLKLIDDQVYFVAAQNWFLDHTVSDAQLFELVTLPNITNYQKIIDRYLAEKGQLRISLLEVPNFITAAQVVMGGTGTAILPGIYIKKFARQLTANQLGYQALPGFKMPLGLAYQANAIPLVKEWAQTIKTSLIPIIK